MGIPDPSPPGPLGRSRPPTAARLARLAFAFLACHLPAPLPAGPDAEPGRHDSFKPAEARRLVPISAEAAAAHSGLLPLKPASGIIDDLDVLTVKQRTALARELILAAVEADTHVYLVTLRKSPAVAPEKFAGELLASWRTGAVSGIVLFIAGENPDQWRDQLFVVPGTPAGSPDLDAALANAATHARANALQARAPREAVDAACRELLAGLRSLPPALRPAKARPGSAASAKAALAGSLAPPGPLPSRDGNAAGRNRHLVVASAAITMALLALALLARRAFQNRPVPIPAREFHYRLCAPYSGGNCARLDFNERHHHPLASSRRADPRS